MCYGSVLLIAHVGKICRRLSIAEKMSYVLGSKNWEDNFEALL